MGMIRRFAFITAIAAAAFGTAQGPAMAATPPQPAGTSMAVLAGVSSQARGDHAIPASDGPVCGSDSSGDQEVCLYINGGGDVVNYMQVELLSSTSTTQVHAEVQYPSGSAFYDGPTINMDDNFVDYTTGGLNPAPAGVYTAIFWQYSSGSYHDLASVTLPVDCC